MAENPYSRSLVRPCVFAARRVCYPGIETYLSNPYSIIHFSRRNCGEIFVITSSTRRKISDKNGNNLSEDRSGVPIGEINDLSG